MESILVTLRHNDYGNETFICSYFDEIMKNPAVVHYIKNWMDEYKDLDPSISYQPLETIPTMSEFILGKELYDNNKISQFQNFVESLSEKR